MAKKGKNMGNKPQGKKRPRRRGASKSGGTRNVMAERVREYAELLADPCGGKLVTGSYPGEVGIVSRFVADSSIAAGNCGWTFYYPAINGVSAANPATPGTATLHSWTVASPFSPGHGLLAPSAAKTRCLAACLEIMTPNVSITNITGEICAGCISADTLGQGVNYTVDQIFAILSQKTILQRTGYSCKFTPGLLDNRFTTYGTLAAADQSDTNVIVVAWRGVPATTTATYRITSVLEWTPRANAGVVASGAETAPGVNHVAVASALHTHEPNWWHNLKHELASDASTAFRYVARGAMAGASKVAANYISEGVAALLL